MPQVNARLAFLEELALCSVAVLLRLARANVLRDPMMGFKDGDGLPVALRSGCQVS